MTFDDLSVSNGHIREEPEEPEVKVTILPRINPSPSGRRDSPKVDTTRPTAHQQQQHTPQSQQGRVLLPVHMGQVDLSKNPILQRLSQKAQEQGEWNNF